MGLDPGTKTIGVALSDPDQRVATPHVTLKKGKLSADVAALRQIIEAYGIGGIVVGHPLKMDGTSGPRAQASRAFQRNLEREIGLPTMLQDERLSTAAVERSLIEQDTSRRKRAEVIDAHAAAFILQGVLDSR